MIKAFGVTGGGPVGKGNVEQTKPKRKLKRKWWDITSSRFFIYPKSYLHRADQLSLW